MANGPVAVVGAGNVGCALAADLTLRGVEVRLCHRSPGRLDAIRAAGGITVTGVVEGVARPARLTTDLAEAVRGAAVVVAALPTTALPGCAGPLLDRLGGDQLLWLDPGHSGGALFLGAQRRRRGRSGPLLCQSSTASHGARLSGPASVRVFATPAASLAAFPVRDLAECHGRVDRLFPGRFGTAASVLELDLANINAVLHPPLVVCNAGWIEATGGDFAIYGQAAGPACARVVAAVDAERTALAGRLGVATLPLLAACARAGYTAPGPDGPGPAGTGAATGGSAAAEVSRALQGAPALQGIRAPATVEHRYLHEDVGWGLAQWVHLAAAAGLAVPAIEALTTLAGVLTGVDYRAGGPTLEAMDLAGVAADGLAAYAADGAARR